jgi:hypothetical protein
MPKEKKSLARALTIHIMFYPHSKHFPLEAQQEKRKKKLFLPLCLFARFTFFFFASAIGGGQR